MYGYPGLTFSKFTHFPGWLVHIAGAFGSLYGTLFRKKTQPLLHRTIARMVTNHHSCNAEKANRLLGWVPTLTLDEAFRKSIDWFVENGIIDTL